jgi:hypothetical protein
MKTLTIYYPHGFKKFPNIYIDFSFEKHPDGSLVITERDTITGEERIHAAFNTWDYVLIEEE